MPSRAPQLSTGALWFSTSSKESQPFQTRASGCSGWNPKKIFIWEASVTAGPAHREYVQRKQQVPKRLTGSGEFDCLWDIKLQRAKHVMDRNCSCQVFCVFGYQDINQRRSPPRKVSSFLRQASQLSCVMRELAQYYSEAIQAEKLSHWDGRGAGFLQWE